MSKVSEKWQIAHNRRCYITTGPYWVTVHWVRKGQWRWSVTANGVQVYFGRADTLKSAQIAAEAWLLERAQEIASVLGKKVVDV